MKIFIPLIAYISCCLANNITIQEIALDGLITNPKQEISGMDWYKDNLILLPENLGGFVFMIEKNKILQAVSQKIKNKILPKQIPFITPDFTKSIPGFDGFEAIAFKGNKVYISIEAEHNDLMQGYIAWGNINPETLEIFINKKNLKKLETPAQINNMSYESIIISNDHAIMLYEANGANIQKKAKQIYVSLSDFSIQKIKFPTIEYRLTDATKIQDNRFWVINYFWPGDKKTLNPAKDRYLKKKTKTNSVKNIEPIERLIELKLHNSSIKKTKSKPISLVLEDGKARNWEALVKMDEHGFLIATDKHPRMIFGYIQID